MPSVPDIEALAAVGLACGAVSLMVIAFLFYIVLNLNGKITREVGKQITSLQNSMNETEDKLNAVFKDFKRLDEKWIELMNQRHKSRNRLSDDHGIDSPSGPQNGASDSCTDIESEQHQSIMIDSEDDRTALTEATPKHEQPFLFKPTAASTNVKSLDDIFLHAEIGFRENKNSSIVAIAPMQQIPNEAGQNGTAGPEDSRKQQSDRSQVSFIRADFVSGNVRQIPLLPLHQVATSESTTEVPIMTSSPHTPDTSNQKNESDTSMQRFSSIRGKRMDSSTPLSARPLSARGINPEKHPELHAKEISEMRRLVNFHSDGAAEVVSRAAVRCLWCGEVVACPPYRPQSFFLKGSRDEPEGHYWTCTQNPTTSMDSGRALFVGEGRVMI